MQRFASTRLCCDSHTPYVQFVGKVIQGLEWPFLLVLAVKAHFLYGFLALLLAGVGIADSKLSFVVGVEDTQYLPHYAVKNGLWAGFGHALLEAFSESRGYRFEYRVMPIERLYRSFLAGEVDFKYPDNPAWRTELKKGIRVFYSAPVVRYIDGVSVLPEKLGQGPEHIRSLGTLRGFTPVSWQALMAQGRVKVLENDSFEGLIKQALIGRIDGIYANIDVVRHQLFELTGGTTDLVFDADLPFSEAHYRLSSTQERQIMREFDQWLMNNQTLISDLKSTYFDFSR